MKYTAALPEHNDNVSHEHPLKDFFLLLAALVAVAALAFWLLGLMIDSVVDRLSPEAEARLNKLVAVDARVAPKREAAKEASGAGRWHEGMRPGRCPRQGDIGEFDAPECCGSSGWQNHCVCRTDR